MAPHSVSVTELRQRLFELADQVAETGEPLLILRRGVRLKLVRDEPVSALPGRFARLKAQSLVVGEPLAPDESPAEWSEFRFPRIHVADSPSIAYGAKPPALKPRTRKPRTR